MDVDAARRDLIGAAHRLQNDNPEVGAILLECTNMGPYAADIGRATGLPVWSIYEFVTWFQSGLEPRSFPPP